MHLSNNLFMHRSNNNLETFESIIKRARKVRVVEIIQSAKQKMSKFSPQKSYTRDHNDLFKKL